MAAERSWMELGWRVFGVGVIGLGVVCLVWRDLVVGQTIPAGVPGRSALIFAAGGLMVIAGGAMEWRRTAARGAAAFSVCALIVMIVVNAPVLPQHYRELGTYFGVAEPFALAAGGLIVYATNTRMDSVKKSRLARVGRMVLGACALFFGSAHFVYMNETAPLIPKWLLPSQVFWGYATGVCFVAAGIALLTGVKARLAAILLTVMLGCFTLLVHIPMLVAKPLGVFNWSELAVNVAILGVAWVAADSFRIGAEAW